MSGKEKMGKMKQFMIEAENDKDIAGQLLLERSKQKTITRPLSPMERFQLVCESKDKTLMNCVRGNKGGCKRVCTLFIEDPAQLGYRIVHGQTLIENKRIREVSVMAYVDRLEKKASKEVPF